MPNAHTHVNHSPSIHLTSILLLAIGQDIERVAHRSIGIVDSLIQERDQLVEMQTEDLFDIEKHCPRLFLITSEANENETMLFQNLTISGSHVSSQLLTATLKDMDRLVEDTVVYARTGLLSVSTTTEQVDSWLDYFFENDWIPKLYLVALNVVNLFLIGGVILSRNNIIHHPYKCMLVWFLIPIFVGLLMMATVGASGLGMAASVNADFCAGGDTVSGPAGTLQDIILSHDVTKEDLSYRSFDYYMNACTTENPLNFVVEYMPLLRDTIRQGNDFLKLVGDISDENTAGALDGMNRECGADASPLVSGVQRLVESLDTVHANIESALDISDCATISPIVRGIFHGSSCKEAVDGLAWMFGTTLGIAMLGLVLITLRAGLYNATIRKARRSKPEATEKEFREYKRYMTQFYDDAPMWKLEPDEIKAKKTKTRRSRGRRRGGMGLEMAPSFETGITATSTFDNNDDDYDKYGNDDSSHESHFADDDLDQDGNNYDDDSSDDDDDSDDVDGLELEFKTPSKHCKRHGENTTTFVDQVRTAEKLRGMMHVLDEEMEPLSPPSQHHHRQEHVSSEHHERQQQQVSPLAEPDDQQRPRAPQKLFRNLQRTTQRKTLL